MLNAIVLDGALIMPTQWTILTWSTIGQSELLEQELAIVALCANLAQAHRHTSEVGVAVGPDCPIVCV